QVHRSSLIIPPPPLLRRVKFPPSVETRTLAGRRRRLPKRGVRQVPYSTGIIQLVVTESFNGGTTLNEKFETSAPLPSRPVRPARRGHPRERRHWAPLTAMPPGAPTRTRMAHYLSIW